MSKRKKRKIAFLLFVFSFVFGATSVLPSTSPSNDLMTIMIQKIIPASEKSITVNNFKFRVVKVAFDKTAMGFVPLNMAKDQKILSVELEILSGSKDSFKGLDLLLADGSGKKYKPIIQISGSIILLLSDVIVKEPFPDYRPETDTIVWSYVVSEHFDEFYLVFPTGLAVDLCPLIK